MQKIAGIVVTFAMCAGSLMALADTSDKDAINYRQLVMTTLNEQTAALGQILSMVVPDDSLSSHLEAVSLAASVALKAFEPKFPGGESKPEVWSNWPDFSKRMNEFAQKTATLARRTKGHTDDDSAAEITDALSCKSCHDAYRDASAE